VEGRLIVPNPDYVVRAQLTAIGERWASSEELFLPERAWDAGRISGDEGISQHLHKLVIAP
jgi:hypothetical protein